MPDEVGMQLLSFSNATTFSLSGPGREGHPLARTPSTRSAHCALTVKSCSGSELALMEQIKVSQPTVEICDQLKTVSNTLESNSLAIERGRTWAGKGPSTGIIDFDVTYVWMEDS